MTNDGNFAQNFQTQLTAQSSDQPRTGIKIGKGGVRESLPGLLVLPLRITTKHCLKRDGAFTFQPEIVTQTGSEREFVRKSVLVGAFCVHRILKVRRCEEAFPGAEQLGTDDPVDAAGPKGEVMAVNGAAVGRVLGVLGSRMARP